MFTKNWREARQPGGVQTNTLPVSRSLTFSSYPPSASVRAQSTPSVTDNPGSPASLASRRPSRLRSSKTTPRTVNSRSGTFFTAAGAEAAAPAGREAALFAFLLGPAAKTNPQPTSMPINIRAFASASSRHFQPSINHPASSTASRFPPHRPCSPPRSSRPGPRPAVARKSSPGPAGDNWPQISSGMR